MTTDTQSLIEQKPHLKDPLEFYDKWQGFLKEAGLLLPSSVSENSSMDIQAYQPENVGAVFQLFASTFELPFEELEPLAKALKSGQINYLSLPLGELPNLSLPINDDELAMILFLFARPYFFALHEKCRLDDHEWKDGRCPLCSARPALASIIEGPKRLLHCSYCGTTGSYRYLGCPNCGNRESAKLSSIMSDDEPGYRISLCDECRTYVKSVDNSILKEMTADQADLASLPLDIVAQGKNYSRKAPNPIGLTKIE